MKAPLQDMIWMPFCLIWILLAGCGKPTLKQTYEKDFLIGAALNLDQTDGKDPRALALVREQFNSITPENILKWEAVHPEPDRYNFEPADRFVELGEKTGMHIVGHTLVWHAQTPEWVFKDGSGKPADRETLLQRMKDHIQAVVGRYKGRIHAWDVVNEALDDDGSMRKSPWFNIIGEDYIQKAFEYAREADPNAILIYNDYNLWKPEKTAAAVRLVEGLRVKGVHVDGIGEQAHWALDYPQIADLEAALKAFAGIGIKVMITEMDVSPLPNPWNYTGADIRFNVEIQKKLNPYPESLPDSMQQKLALRYGEFFSLFHKYSDSISRVTFWGVTDAQSWLNFWPVRGRKNYPLLFDRNYAPKPAFYAVIKAAQKP
jgi:endo-1,4-beta-xylanase